MDATIISDIHLGSDVCQAKDLCDFLDNLDTNRLILNGDVFDSMDFRRLKKHHWHVLSKLRKLSDNLEIIWVSGNHDGPADIISHLIGIPVVENYTFLSGDKTILVLHGHIFDNFLDSHPILTIIGDSIYWLLQKIDKSHYFARLAKYNSKAYLRCSSVIKQAALKLATKLGCDIVCVGHTHHAEEDYPYFNSGCWTEKPSTYLEASEGQIGLRTWISHSS